MMASQSNRSNEGAIAQFPAGCRASGIRVHASRDVFVGGDFQIGFELEPEVGIGFLRLKNLRHFIRGAP